MLRQSLKSLGADPQRLIAAAGLRETARPEEIPVSGFVALANALGASSSERDAGSRPDEPSGQ
jgi:16S rRNA (adenine1518-N6/adenine1519-N6)-dimethyltransferase